MAVPPRTKEHDNLRSRRALFVDHATGLGGAEHSLSRLMNGLAVRNWTPVLACPAGALSAAATAAGIAWYDAELPRIRHSRRSIGSIRTGARRLAELARNTGSCAIVANTARAAPYAIIASKMAGVPSIWHIRDFSLREDPNLRPLVDRIVRNALCRTATRLVACSSAVAATLPASRTSIVYNSIDQESFGNLPDRNVARQSIGIGEAVPVVCMVGRMRPWKGAMTFLKMAKAVLQEVPDATFIIAGGTPLGEDHEFAAEAEHFARSFATAKQVVFTGHLSDVRPVLAASNVFVHPGAPEPFGLVLLEAMTCGLPVVGFAHGALPELVDQNGSGLLVPPNDTSALAAAVIELLADPDRARSFGDAGRSIAAARFGLQREISGFEAVLDSVCTA